MLYISKNENRCPEYSECYIYTKMKIDDLNIANAIYIQNKNRWPEYSECYIYTKMKID